MSIWLNKLGAEVTGYSLDPPTNPSLFELADLKATTRSIIKDIRHLDDLKQAMTESRPDILFHMAAQPLVRESYYSPVSTYETNIMGTVNILESARSCLSLKSVVIITSDKCYANQEWLWGYRENEPMGGFDPYSSSKGCAELVVDGYRQSFFNTDDFDSHGVAIATARAGNVIGGGDWADDRLVPDCISALIQQQTISIRNPDSIRPWQHVLEPLSGYLYLAESLYEKGPEYSGAWNFGPNDSDCRSVLEIVQILCQQWGGSAHYQVEEKNGPHEAGYLKLDSSKARSLLHWNPRWNLENALKKVVQWSQVYQSKGNLASICQDQIDQFECEGA